MSGSWPRSELPKDGVALHAQVVPSPGWNGWLRVVTLTPQEGGQGGIVVEVFFLALDPQREFRYTTRVTLPRDAPQANGVEAAISMGMDDIVRSLDTAGGESPPRPPQVKDGDASLLREMILLSRIVPEVDERRAMYLENLRRLREATHCPALQAELTR